MICPDLAHGISLRATEARRRTVHPESEPKQRRPKVLVYRRDSHRHLGQRQRQLRRRGRPQQWQWWRGQREAQAVLSVFLADAHDGHHQRGALEFYVRRHAHQG